MQCKSHLSLYPNIKLYRLNASLTPSLPQCICSRQCFDAVAPLPLRKALEKQKTVAHPVDTVQSQMLRRKGPEGVTAYCFFFFLMMHLLPDNVIFW